MPVFGPVKRHELIAGLRKLGFKGPFSGGAHQYMVKNGYSIRIPNPHVKDIGKSLLSRILRQAHISRKEWEMLNQSRSSSKSIMHFPGELSIKKQPDVLKY
jgi:predicted RNA binding protein YcfA (HicA-like mRNA interferase family)